MGIGTVDLRRGLTPPELDEDKVRQLAELADRIDGARPGEWEDELSQFNDVVGTSLSFADFQGVYGAEEHEEWVRRLFYHQLARPVNDVTTEELTEVVRRAMPQTGKLEDYQWYMAVFDANVPMAGASNLIFYPPNYDPDTNTWNGRLIGEYDPTPEQIVDWAMNPDSRDSLKT